MGVYTLVVVVLLGLLLSLALGTRANRHGRAVDLRAGGSRERGSLSDLVQGLVELLGHLRVLGEDLALDDGLHGELKFHLFSGVAEDSSLAAAHTSHLRGDGCETVKALTNGLATLLLGDDVVLLLLSIGETLLVDAAVVAGRGRARGLVAGSHGD
jgi:hypothetical protein